MGGSCQTARHLPCPSSLIVRDPFRESLKRSHRPSLFLLSLSPSFFLPCSSSPSHFFPYTSPPSRSFIDCDRNLAVNQNHSFFSFHETPLVRISATRENIFLWSVPFLFLSLCPFCFFLSRCESSFCNGNCPSYGRFAFISRMELTQCDGGRICGVFPTCAVG